MIPLTAALRAAFEQGLRDDKCVFVQPKDGLAMIAVIEAAKEYVAAVDQSADAGTHNDDVAAMVRYGIADNAIRAAIDALDKEQK